MFPSEANRILAVQQLQSDVRLRELAQRLAEMKLAADIERAETELLELLNHDNHLIRDAAMIRLSEFGRVKPAWVQTQLPQLLQSTIPRIRAEAAHLLGYLPREQVARFRPVLFLLMFEPSTEVFERSRQAIERTGNSVNPLDEAMIRHAVAALTEAATAGNAVAEVPISDIATALKLLTTRRSGEAPIAEQILREAIANILK